MSEDRLKEIIKDREHQEQIKHERYYARLIAVVAAVIIAVMVYLYNQEHGLRMKLLDEYETLKADYEELLER